MSKMQCFACNGERTTVYCQIVYLRMFTMVYSGIRFYMFYIHLIALETMFINTVFLINA